MNIKEVKYNNITKIVTCSLDIAINDIVSQFEISLTDEELSSISLNWWLPEIESLLKIKITNSLTSKK